MNIYDINGNIRCVVQKFSYNDTFMGETFLTMDIESPNAIPFEIGDNCSYRGDIFTLNYVPSVEKTASANSRGDAFKYSSVKMNSVADELTRCRMLDIVPDDMNVVWTGLPEFSFYAQTVNDLARRIQANLDSLYKDAKKWTVTTNLANLVDYNGVLCSISGKTPIDSVMSISDKSCMEILAECWNTFRVTYIIRGRTITIAPKPIEVGATFGYGKGQGLYGLQQQTKQDAQIITRLYVYGSTRNIGNHYYANLTGKGKGTIDSAVSSLETERLSFDASTGIIHDGTINLTLGGVTHNIPMNTSLNVANTVRDHIYDLRTTEFPSWTLTKGDVNSVIRIDFSIINKYIDVNVGSRLTIEFQGQTLYVPFTQKFTYSQVSSFVNYIHTRFLDLDDSGGEVQQYWSIVNYVNGDTHLDFRCFSAGPRRNAEIRLNNITGLGVTPTLTEKGSLYLDFKANSGGGRLETPTINVNGTGLVASVFTSTYGLYPYGTGSNLYYFTLDFAYGTKYYKESTTQNGVAQYIVKFKAGDIEVNGYIELDDTHVVGIVYQSEPNSAAFYSAMQTATYIYITSGLYLDLLSSEYVSYNETISGNLAVNRLMLPDFPLVHNSPNDVYLDSPNIAKYGIRQGYVIFDGSDTSKPEIYPTIHQMTAKNVIDSGITLSLDSAEGTDMSAIRLDKIKGVIMPTDGTKDGNIPTSVDYNYNSWQTTFTIFLKDLGFDLSQISGDKYYYATSDKMSISMISGTCAGREFQIDSIKRNTDLGYLRYELVCERSQDTNINKVYPYDSYPVSSGDEFVILNCRLPKVYVDANAQKLKDYGQAYLAKNDKTKYTYSPKVDEIWMDKNPTIANSIKAGDIFDFSDVDLDLNVKSFIHTLSIKVGDKILPSYDITLDEEVESTTIQKIQNQINNISIATDTSTNITDVQQAISTYGNDYFVSKNNDDTVSGNISFKHDISVRGKSVLQSTSTSDLKVGNDLTVDGKALLNDVVANTGTFGGLLKAAAATITGALLASTVSATTMSANTFIGELQGNAATATKLKTARTIWGQSFDGTGNVDGELFINNGIIIGQEGMQSLDGIPYHGVIMGHANYNSWNFGEYGGQYNFYLSMSTTTNASLIARIDTNNNYLSGSLGIGTTSPAYKLDVNGNSRVASDLYLDATVGTRNFASHATGWRADRNGNADFRNIYSDELRVQAFTADISQALAGSDYLTKSVSKLSANFVVPSVNSTVRIIVDDIEGMPATQCFTNGDYIRFRAFNRTSGLTIANVWGTVTLDTTYGSGGYLNGTQAYTFTCTQTTGAGLTVFKGSEVLDYGTSESGLIARTTLDTMGSPYEQIATWKTDPSNGNNYTVHARLGNLGGIANCNGYGVYTDNGFFTGKVVIGDLTKTANFLSFDTVNGLQLKLGNSDVATTLNGIEGRVSTAEAKITSDAINLTVKSQVDTAYGNAVAYTNSQISVTNNNISLAVNNIHVGGRNLIRNGDFSNGEMWTRSNGYTSFQQITTDLPNGFVSGGKFVVPEAVRGFFYILSIDEIGFSVFESGKPYTLSYYAKVSSPCQMDAGFEGLDIPTKDLTTSWQQFSTTVIGDGYNHAVVFYPSQACELYITGVQIKKSTKVEDYTKAPEDVDASINLKVSKDGVIGAINLTSEAATIQASKINLNGAVTIGAIDKSSVTPSALGAATPTDINTAVGNIQIGGRNLIIYSRLISGMIDSYGNVASDSIRMCDPNFYACSGNQSFVASVHSNPTPKGGNIALAFYDSNKNYLRSVIPFYNGDVITPIFTSPSSARYYRYAICYKENICKIEFGNKTTDWTPAPEDVDASINGIQIGGRNLIVGSSTATVNSNWSTNGCSQNFSTYSDRIYKIIATNGWQTSKYKFGSSYSGKTLTISFYAKIISSETTATVDTRIMYSNEKGNNPYQTDYFDMTGNTGTNNMPVKDTWIYCKKTIVLNSDCQLGILVGSSPEGSGLKTTVLIKDLKVEEGNKATSWTPSPEDVAQDAQDRVDTLSRAHGGLTYLDDHSIYTGTLTANQVNAVAIDAGSITAGTLNADRIDVNSVSAAVAKVISLNASSITTGTLSADRIAGNTITGDKLVMNTITALGNVTAGSFNLGNGKFVVDANGNTTTVNMNAVNATISGTLKGVSGTFDYLKGVGSSGSLVFGKYGMTFEDEDFSQQGTKNSRSLRFYSGNIRCRGSFGATSLNMARVHDTVIDYYVNGDTNSYVRFNLQKNGVGGYYIPLYPTSDTGYSSAYGNATLADIYGFPVDLVVFDNTAACQYELIAGFTGKKVTVVNAHDGDHSVFLNINGNSGWLLSGGKAQIFINIRELTNPLISSSVHGAGWLLCGEYDNNWA